MALIAPLLVRLLGHRASWVLALLAALVFAGFAMLLPQVAAGQAIHVAVAWVPSLGIDFALAVDGLGLTFALTVSGIGALVILYSGPYLRGDPRQGRFFAVMLAFMGAMLGIVLADGLVPLYVFWELTAVTSFLLIGFDRTRQSARRAALQALLITVGGGLCLLLGIVLLHAVTGAWTISAIAAAGAPMIGATLGPVAALVIVAAFTKSAQFPFHFWLPNAMEAPTPVSAYLHSAAMVQAGIYLLLRFAPILDGAAFWMPTLLIFGGVTMLWGSAGLLRQTDLKQLLAHSTVASLGLLVLLIGLGGEAGMTAAIVYFLAHALYKGGFFLIAGLIDHETGVRDLTALGGLKDRMAATFIAAILAGFSMLGLPPALGYLAKEGIYGALGPLRWDEALVPVALILANAAMGAAALALVAKPFLGREVTTPKPPHEGPPAMLAGAVLLGAAGIAAAILGGWTVDHLIAPAVSAVLRAPTQPHLGFALSLADPAIWLSLATWGLSGVLYWRLDTVRTLLRRIDAPNGWSFDRVFDVLMAGLLEIAGHFARTWQNGRLRFYIGTFVVAATLAILCPLVLFGGWATDWSFSATPVEAAVCVLAAAGLLAIIFASSLLVAILALGVQGLAVALIYLLFGAPDLSFTQFIVETLSVVMFALLLVRLRLDGHARRPPRAAVRDGIIALAAGGSFALLLLAVVSQLFDDRLGSFFARAAVPLAHGRNIVNVILVDFRGLDTLGEISVVLAAGVGVLVLMATRRRERGPPAGDPKPDRMPSSRQRAARPKAAA